MTSSPARLRTGAASTVSVASAPGPVVVLDADGHIAEFNEAAAALLPAARVGQPLSSPAWLATADPARPVSVSGAVGAPPGRRRAAPDARTAPDRLAEGPPARPVPAHQAIGGLPHLGDQEYTLVAKSATRLVRDTFRRLERHVPAMRDYSDERRERTALDIAHLVGFLSAALYVDADEIVTGFPGWTAEVLTARRVPARSLLPCLDLLEEQLHDFPRARRILAAGRTALASLPTLTDAGRGAAGRPGGPRPPGG